jgi:hypothetical protein
MNDLLARNKIVSRLVFVPSRPTQSPLDKKIIITKSLPSVNVDKENKFCREPLTFVSSRKIGRLSPGPLNHDLNWVCVAIHLPSSMYNHDLARFPLLLPVD